MGKKSLKKLKRSQRDLTHSQLYSQTPTYNLHDNVWRETTSRCYSCVSHQTLKARLARRPLARSNFLPFDRTYGLVELCGTPGALPICRHASRAFRRPCTNRVFLPVQWRGLAGVNKIVTRLNCHVHECVEIITGFANFKVHEK